MAILSPLRHLAIEASTSVRWWLHGVADWLWDAAPAKGLRARMLFALSIGCDRVALAMYRVETRWTRHHSIEAVAALCGLLGALLLASRGDHAAWGWAAFLASNAGWIAFGWIRGHWFLLLQQIGFTATSLLGIWKWLL